MKNKDFISKLKEIKTGQPNSEWVKRNRDVLLYQIKAQQGSRFEMFSKDGANYTWSAIRLFFPTRLAYRLAAAICLVIVLIAGSSITTTWADRSLPGDFLYPVKLTSERVQLAFTFDAESETKLQVEFAGKRLQEVEQISSLGGQSDGSKADKIKTSLDGYKKNIQQVKSDLDKINKESEPGKAAELASLVSKQVGGYSVTLGNKLGDSASAISEAILASDQVVDKSISVVLERYAQVGGNRVPVSSQELKAIFDNKVDNLNKIAVLIDGQIKFGQGLLRNVTDEAVRASFTEALNKDSAELEALNDSMTQVQETFASGETMTALRKVVEISTAVQELKNKVDETVSEIQIKAVPAPDVKGEETEKNDQQLESENNK